MRGLRGGAAVLIVLAASGLPGTEPAGATTHDAGTEAEWRAAVAAAAADTSGPQVITITDDFTMTEADSPRYDGEQPLTVDGGDHVVSGSPANTRFLEQQRSHALVTIQDLTVRDFQFVGAGGAVYFSFNGLVQDTTFVDNHTPGDGGAIWSSRELLVRDSAFTTNTVDEYGGAVAGYGITIEDSTFDGNVAERECGAVLAYGGSRPSGIVARSTFTGNRAEGGPSGVGGALCAVDGLISDSTFIANHGDGRGGAVITFDAPIVRSTFTDNTSDDSGGAVHGGIVDVRDSTFSGNVAPLAGAVHAENTGGIGEAELTVANSTFTANHSTASGGVVDNTSVNPGVTNLRYVTFAGNRSAGAGADISVGAGGMTVFGTVFDDPVDAPSCAPGGPVRSSYSYATDTSCQLAGPGDTQGAPSPGLGPLADNGGPTRTRAPLTGSPLLEGVPLDACDLGLLVDQRGLTRPRDADESTPEYGCDIGAVEPGAERPDPTPTTTTTSTTSTTLPEPTTSTSTTTTVAPGTAPAGVARPVAVTPRFTG